MAWIGSLVASVLITLEVHRSLNVGLVCVVKLAVLGARLEKNRSTQVTSAIANVQRRGRIAPEGRFNSPT